MQINVYFCFFITIQYFCRNVFPAVYNGLSVFYFGKKRNEIEFFFKYANHQTNRTDYSHVIRHQSKNNPNQTIDNYTNSCNSN